jgi:hypothetical protein
VLITSRFSDWSELANEVALAVLPLEEAIAFLRAARGRSDAAGAKTPRRGSGGKLTAIPWITPRLTAERTQLRFYRLRSEGIRAS